VFFPRLGRSLALPEPRPSDLERAGRYAETREGVPTNRYFLLPAPSVSDSLRLAMAYQSPLEALAESTRRQIFEKLRHGPLPVGKIADHVPVSRPAVSQHLKVLQQAGLVRQHRVGTRHLYSIDLNGLAEVRSYFEQFWDDVLAAFQTKANQEKK
jgi:DNA-binding transcriptional ArsR family regulator